MRGPGSFFGPRDSGDLQKKKCEIATKKGINLSSAPGVSGDKTVEVDTHHAAGPGKPGLTS